MEQDLLQARCEPHRPGSLALHDCANHPMCASQLSNLRVLRLHGGTDAQPGPSFSTKSAAAFDGKRHQSRHRVASVLFLLGPRAGDSILLCRSADCSTRASIALANGDIDELALTQERHHDVKHSSATDRQTDTQTNRQTNRQANLC